MDDENLTSTESDVFRDALDELARWGWAKYIAEMREEEPNQFYKKSKKDHDLIWSILMEFLPLNAERFSHTLTKATSGIKEGNQTALALISHLVNMSQPEFTSNLIPRHCFDLSYDKKASPNSLRIQAEILALGVEDVLDSGEHFVYADYGYAYIQPGAGLRIGPFLVTNKRLFVSGNYPMKAWHYSLPTLPVGTHKPIYGALDYFVFDKIRKSELKTNRTTGSSAIDFSYRTNYLTIRTIQPTMWRKDISFLNPQRDIGESEYEVDDGWKLVKKDFVLVTLRPWPKTHSGERANHLLSLLTKQD